MAARRSRGHVGMLDPHFVILGALLGFVGTVRYISDVFRGKAKPNKVTWFLWAFAPFIAFWAQLKEGVGLQALLTFMVGFSPLCVLVASFVSRQSYWKITTFDLVCGILAIGGLLLWQVTGNGNVAISFAILADGLAALPTLAKSYKYPETESYLLFLLVLISAGVTLLTIDTWNYATYAFPAYMLLINAILFVLIRFRPRALRAEPVAA